ncbi:MAG: hypothetical protein HZB55_02295 [Deltaproteobacteria bacterium]|nr:hypothetical protein [Deltaproteobacteria bacterium]
MREWRSRVSRVLQKSAILGGAALALWAASPAAAAPEKLAITSAVYKAERSELRIEGRCKHVDSIVLVRDATTKKLIGSAAVRADGVWMLKIRDPNFVPTRTRAECDGARAECAVETLAVASPAVAAQGAAGPIQ